MNPTAKAFNEIKFHLLEPNQAISFLCNSEDILNASNVIGSKHHYDDDSQNHRRELERVSPNNSSAHDKIEKEEEMKRRMWSVFR
jgi:hypothetical protein